MLYKNLGYDEYFGILELEEIDEWRFSRENRMMI